MKRSEMLEILNDAIIERGISEHCYNHVDDLSYILQKLEEAGMKPPSYYKTYKPLPSKIAHVEISEWEPEDNA